MTPKNILIIAGEQSATTYACHLANALKKESPKTTLIAIADQSIETHVNTLYYNTQSDHAMGQWENWKKRHQTKALLKAIQNCLVEKSIDHCIVVDFQHVNTAIAKLCQKNNIPISTFITPNYWIWSDTKNCQKIARYSQNVICIFKKEYALYKTLSPRPETVHYFGHPIRLIHTPIKRAKNHFQSTPKTITLFPGSRKQEIHYHFPQMLQAIQILQKAHPKLICQVAIAREALRPSIETYLKQYPIQNLQSLSTENKSALKKSHLVITVAGTSTLEFVLDRTPFISLGAISPITYFIAKYLLNIRIPFISLPNIMLEKALLPELKQSEITPKAIYKLAIKLLDPSTAQHLIDQFSELILDMDYPKNTFQQSAKCILKSCRAS